MDVALLADTLADRGQPAYRARQVWEWAARGAGGYEDMTNLPQQLRDALLECVHRRVRALLLVADDGRGHRGAHPRARLRRGVGAEIDHAAPRSRSNAASSASSFASAASSAV